MIDLLKKKELHIERRINLYAEDDGITCDVSLKEIEDEMTKQLERVKYLFYLYD